MTIFLTILFTLAAVAGLVVFAIWFWRDDIARYEAEVEAWHRAWDAAQVEYDAERRLRDATRDAMNQMLAEVRKHDPSGGGSGANHG